MGRPAGSKNKPKVIKMLDLQVKEGKKKVRKPRAVKPKIDWEVLAKQLQQALAKEIQENDKLKAELSQANRALVQMSGIIQYLEGKRGNNSI